MNNRKPKRTRSAVRRTGSTNKRWPLVVVLVAGLLLVALTYAVLNRDAPVAGVASARQEQLQSLVHSYVAEQPGTHGVAINSLDGSRAVMVNAERQFPAASLFKLFVMYRVFDRAAAGRLNLDSNLTVAEADAVEVEPEGGLAVGQTVSVRRALDAMITVSSNSAAYALARVAGGWDTVRAVPRELGLRSTHYDDGWWTTAADLEDFFVALAERRLVSQSASDEMLRLLARQKRNDRIPAQLPASVSVAHKTGELEDVRNDAGIVESRDARYVIVLLSEDPDPNRAIKAQAQLSRLVYDFLAE